MFSTVYHKKAFVLKIPPRPPLPAFGRKKITKGGDVSVCPLPKGDHKDDRHFFMRFLPTRLGEDSLR
jgi:hypothetical protein